jgi:methionyl aminopeptidase
MILDKKKMKEASQLAVYVLKEVEKIIKPGISTLEIDNLSYKIITENGGWPAALNYNGFPKSVCTSINDVVCHGIPNEKDILYNGDFINVDVALKLNGYYGDTSRCFFVGKVNDKYKKLVNITYEAMWNAINICRHGLYIKEIGKIIEATVKSYKYGVVRDFCGHGIGKELHMDVNIPFYYDCNNNEILEYGKCYTIEPMINENSYKIRILNDGWTAKTIDGGRSAQWEHTIYINENGCEVMSFNEFDKINKKSEIINCL